MTAVETLGFAADRPRRRVAADVARTLDEARINYVFLHGSDRPSAADSDLDLAVDRKGLDALDALLRTGVLGRLVQRFDYDVPWCRYYVLATREPERRYVALDVACDPWGIGRDGPAVPLALASAEPRAGLRVPSPAAACVYLAAKRSRKGLSSPQQRAALAAAFRKEPAAAAELLERAFGQAGAKLAAALAGEAAEVEVALRAIRGAIVRRRLTPGALARRAAFGSSRLIRRILRPTGLHVCLVGPDGAGKSALADALVAAPSSFRRSVRIAPRGGVLPPPARLLRRELADSSSPHARAPSGHAGSAVRLTYLWLDAVLGWAIRVVGPRIRSTLLVDERGWADLVVDPRRYRISLPPALVRALGALVPEPDLVLVLEAPAPVIRARKPELELAEIERQLRAWRGHAASAPARVVRLDALRSPEAVLVQALAAIDDSVAARQRDLSAATLALRCLGGPAPRGREYRILSRSNSVRWIVPVGRGPAGSGLYRPARARDVPGARALELVQRTRVGRRVPVDPAAGLAPAIAQRLLAREVVLAAAATATGGRELRALLSVRADGAVVAFAKVAADRSGLAREREVLDELAGCELRRIVVPRALDLFAWEGLSVLLLAPVPTPGRADHDLGTAELDALVELAELQVFRAGDGLVPVHGDFAPWNCARQRGGRLALWDWERARAGLPLEDLYHWRLKRLAVFGHGTLDELVRGALTPDPQVRSVCDALGIDAALAPWALLGTLERALAETPGHPTATRALSLLGVAA